MSAPSPDLTKIKEAGWRQGSALPSPLVESLVGEGLLPFAVSSKDLLIVLSHDCDVTSSSLTAEPYVELLCLRRVDKRDGNLDWGKNPRRYQFVDSRTSKSLIYEVSVHERALVPRERLVGYEPEPTKALDAEIRSRLCRWVAARYTRASFPDSFNVRVSPAIERLRTLFKTMPGLLSGIYLLVVDDELPKDKDYKVTIFATMLDEDYNDPLTRASAQELLDQLEAIMNDCDGIDIGHAELRSEAELSLHDLRKLKRWDYDDLSLRRGTTKDLPPDP